MKGKHRFSQFDAGNIRAILREQPRKKETRDKLRAIQFYISDFDLPAPFTVGDFERLVASGEIVIASDRAEEIVANGQSSRARSAPVDMVRVETERLKYRPDRIKYLLVG